LTTQHKPFIGITSGLQTNASGSTLCQVGQAYIHAILNAGGIPLILPTVTDANAMRPALTGLDGVLFTGGSDIDPRRFNGKPHARIYGVSPDRDQLEFSLLDAALSAGKPILCICRGIQVLNVAFGGTLFTDIQDQYPNALRHDWFPDIPRDYLAHQVRLTEDSQLHDILDADEIEVNSLHHQGIAAIGPGLTATAYAPDGLVEGLEAQDHPFVIGVQWHPECLPEDPFMQKLFKAFILACQEG
jgi:putative glutamine amidotransferase